MPYARKQRIAPNQRSMANPEKRHWQNLIHSGVVGGGVNWFSPCSRIPFATCRGKQSVYDGHKDGEYEDLVVSETFADVGVEPLAQLIHTHLDSAVQLYQNMQE